MSVGNLLETFEESGGESFGFPFFKAVTDQTIPLRLLVNVDKGKGGRVHNIRSGTRFNGSFTCTDQPDCPGCLSGNKPNYRGWLLAWVPDLKKAKQGETAGQVQIISGGKRMMEGFIGMHTAYGDARFRDLLLKRTGEKYETRYLVYPRATKEEVMALMEKVEGVESLDTTALLLAGDSSITPKPIDAETAQLIAEQFKLESWDGDILDAIADKAQELLDRVSAPVSAEKMEAILAGKKFEEKDGKAETAGDEDFEI